MKTLTDMSERSLRKAMRATAKVAGENSESAKILRAAIAKKRHIRQAKKILSERAEIIFARAALIKDQKGRAVISKLAEEYANPTPELVSKFADELANPTSSILPDEFPNSVPQMVLKGMPELIELQSRILKVMPKFNDGWSAMIIFFAREYRWTSGQVGEHTPEQLLGMFNAWSERQKMIAESDKP